MNIENEYLRVAVNPKGGALSSIYDKKRNVELLYQPLKDSWQGQDVFIFPFVARLKGGEYHVDGKAYSLKNHGLIRYMTGEEMMRGDDLVVMFKSDESTLTQYPFQFEAESRYHLDGKTLTVSYCIKNLSDKEMPYMVGGHPAFKIPGERNEQEFDMTKNEIVFDKTRKLRRVLQDETFSYCIEDVDYCETNRIALSKQLFRDINTIILLAKEFECVDLVKGDGSILRLHKKDAEFLALWSDPKWGDYIAIEPWNGIPDELDPKMEMKDKRAASLLKPGEEFVFSYAVEIIK